MTREVSYRTWIIGAYALFVVFSIGTGLVIYGSTILPSDLPHEPRYVKINNDTWVDNSLTRDQRFRDHQLGSYGFQLLTIGIGFLSFSFSVFVLSFFFHPAAPIASVTPATDPLPPV